MVLIIRNNRIQSRRHSKLKNLISYIVPKEKKKLAIEKPKDSYFTMAQLVNTLGPFFLCSIAMFTFPFVAFFGVQHIMLTNFHTDRFITNCASAVAAVIVVNIIIGAYAYKALHENEAPNEVSKESSEENDSHPSDDANKKIK